MKKIIILFIAFLSMSSQVIAQADYQRLRVFVNETDLHTLAHKGVDLSHIHLIKNSYLEQDFSPYEVEQIKEAGLNYEILYKNASEYYHDQRRKSVLLKSTSSLSSNCAEALIYEQYSEPEEFDMGDMGGFFTYEQMLWHLDNMHALYPNLVSEPQPISDFLTYEGRPIHHLTITKPDSTIEKKQILYTALHHAREPISMSQLIYFMYYVLENFDNDPSIKYLLEQYELNFVPCINPDGYVYNNEVYLANPNAPTFGFWRKNKRDNDLSGAFNPNLDGVDLNRNYGYKWGYDPFGSSPSPASNVYRGPFAFSEPETQAMQWLCEQNQFYVALNYHSFGNLLIYPWGYELGLVTDHNHVFETIGQSLTSQNEYVAGTAETTIAYPANGNSDDWMYGDTENKQSIFSFTPEVGTGVDGFYPTDNQIVKLCQQNILQNLNALRVLGSFGKATDLTGAHLTQLNGQLHFDIKQNGLETGHFTVNVTPISPELTIEAYIETPNLSVGDIYQDSLTYTLDENFIYGQEIIYAISVDNGEYITTDTITKIYKVDSTNVEVLVDNACDDLTLWNNNGWGITTLEFHSENASLTDSPVGNYESNQYSELILKDTLDLTNATYAELNFWAKWVLEEYYDYVQIIATNVETNAQTSLCGKYTDLVLPANDEPVYHNAQTTWVEESIPLNDFLGEKIQIKFTLQTDDLLTYDGFYLDDVRLHINQDTTELDTIDMGIDALQTQNLHIAPAQPNPTKDWLNINYHVPQNAKNTAFYLLNEVGQIVHQQNAQKNAVIKLDVSRYPNGIYFYYLQSDQHKSNLQKVVIY